MKVITVTIKSAVKQNQAVNIQGMNFYPSRDIAANETLELTTRESSAGNKYLIEPVKVIDAEVVRDATTIQVPAVNAAFWQSLLS